MREVTTKKGESKMKIYSAVDADKAREFIGCQGYFGDSLEAIKNMMTKSKLIKINEEKDTYRFTCDEGVVYALFKPIIKTWRECRTFEEAIKFLGVPVRAKDCEYGFLITEIATGDDGSIYIDVEPARGIFDNYETLGGKPVGVLDE